MNPLRRAYSLIEAAKGCTQTDKDYERVDGIQLYEKYAEPGYDTEVGVAVGNWNPSDFKDRRSPVVRVGNLLERLGFSLEWEDEWRVCDHCRGVVRVEPNGYDWTRSYIVSEYGDITCKTCFLAYAPWVEEWIEANVGSTRTCFPFSDYDLGKHGYVKLDLDLRAGLHLGDDFSAAQAGRWFDNNEVKRYLFSQHSQDQFTAYFRAWVHRDDLSNVGAVEERDFDGPSIAGACMRALKGAS